MYGIDSIKKFFGYNTNNAFGSQANKPSSVGIRKFFLATSLTSLELIVNGCGIGRINNIDISNNVPRYNASEPEVYDPLQNRTPGEPLGLPPEEPKQINGEGLPTWAWVTIGAGSAVLVGTGIYLAVEQPWKNGGGGHGQPQSGGGENGGPGGN